MPGLFSRGGRSRSRAEKPNPMAAKMAGVLPAVPPAPSAAPASPVTEGDPADLLDDGATDHEAGRGTEAAGGGTQTTQARNRATENRATQNRATQNRASESAATESAATESAATEDRGLATPAASAPRIRANRSAAVAPAQSAKAQFSLRAGYNLPAPDQFARNRQRVGRAFGEVLVTGGAVVLRLRRKRVGRLLPPVRLVPADIRLASPTETDFMGNNRGVVFERHDGEHVYVWVDEPSPLLTVLSIQGFAVGPDPVPVTRAG